MCVMGPATDADVDAVADANADTVTDVHVGRVLFEPEKFSGRICSFPLPDVHAKAALPNFKVFL